jgi:hypothetical protein
MCVVNKFIFLCLLFLSSASWAELPLDSHGEELGKTLAMAKACGILDLDASEYRKKFIFLMQFNEYSQFSMNLNLKAFDTWLKYNVDKTTKEECTSAANFLEMIRHDYTMRIIHGK